MEENVLEVVAEEVAPIIKDYQKYELEQGFALDLAKGIPSIVKERDLLFERLDSVLAMDKDDPKSAKVASELRKAIKNNRTQGFERWRKTTGDVYLRAKQFIDAIGKMQMAINEDAENKLEEIEKYQAIKEQERLRVLNEERKSLLIPYIEDGLQLPDLSQMSQDVFDSFLFAKKSTFEAKIIAEKKAEQERIEKEKIQNLHNDRFKLLIPFWDLVEDKDANFGILSQEEFDFFLSSKKTQKLEIEKEQERIRIENEKLKKEAEEKEKQLLKEREEAEAKAKAIQEEFDRKAREEKEKQDAILKAEQESKAKLEAELKTRKEAEEKAEADRVAKELKAKLDAEQLVKEPIKQQLLHWIDSFTCGLPPNDETIANTILLRFQGFKDWAKKEIQSL